MTRSDKRKDRVEISPIQLHLAVVEAEVRLSSLGSRTIKHIHEHSVIIENRKGTGAEDMHSRMGKEMTRSIVFDNGWLLTNMMFVPQYHSHPHITVFPSHIGMLHYLRLLDMNKILHCCQ